MMDWIKLPDVGRVAGNGEGCTRGGSCATGMAVFAFCGAFLGIGVGSGVVGVFRASVASVGASAAT